MRRLYSAMRSLCTLLFSELKKQNSLICPLVPLASFLPSFGLIVMYYAVQKSAEHLRWGWAQWDSLSFPAVEDVVLDIPRGTTCPADPKGTLFLHLNWSSTTKLQWDFWHFNTCLDIQGCGESPWSQPQPLPVSGGPVCSYNFPCPMHLLVPITVQDESGPRGLVSSNKRDN